MRKKLLKGLISVIELIRAPQELKMIRRSNRIWKRKVLKEYPTLSQLPILPIEKFLIYGIKDIDPYYFLGDGSSVMDLLLLNNLASSIHECSYFEIGIWRGESILNVSKFAQKCLGMDLPDSYFIDDKERLKIIEQRNERLEQKNSIKRLEADSTKFDFSCINEKFDLIFIDGNHSYESVKSDTNNAFNYLVKAGGYIVWHDYGYNPEETRYEVLKGILDGLPAKEHQFVHHVSHTKCAIWTRKKTIAIQTKDDSTLITLPKSFTISIKDGAPVF